MTQSVIRECRICGLEKPCRPGRRQCKDCDAAYRREWAERTRRHVPGRQRNYRQHAEIEGVLDGNNSWVTCSTCRQMKLYKPKANGKGGKGWKALQCADCTAAAAREFRAAKKEQPTSSGVCSKCGKTGPYENGRQCKPCFRSHGAAYQRTRRADGKGKPVEIPAHSRICGKCHNRCRIAGVWQGDTCPVCWKKAESIRAKKKRAELKSRMTSAGEWTCNECHAVKPVEDGAKGWQGQKCPECQRAKARARYHEVLKDNPEYKRKKKARHRRDYERRKFRAVQDAKNQGATRSTGGMDTKSPQTPEMPPQG